MSELSQLESHLNYQFNDAVLLNRALSHRSYNNLENYERLEFLGDSLLNCIIGQAVFKRYPDSNEGELTRMRAALVNQTQLVHIAEKLSLSDFIQLGSGEKKSGGQKRHSILSDVVESVIGAIYLDSDFNTVCYVVLNWFGEDFSSYFKHVPIKDPKSRLQEWVQAQKYSLPVYDIVKITGAAHDQTFVVSCKVKELPYQTSGEHKSRRRAEQVAAAAFLEQLTDAQDSQSSDV